MRASQIGGGRCTKRIRVLLHECSRRGIKHGDSAGSQHVGRLALRERRVDGHVAVNREHLYNFLVASTARSSLRNAYVAVWRGPRLHALPNKSRAARRSLSTPCGSATYELLAHHPQRATRHACGRCGCARRRLWCPKAFPGCPASFDHAESLPRRDWRCATRGVSEASSSTCSHLHGCVLLDSQPSRELAWSALGRLRSLHAVCAT